MAHYMNETYDRTSSGIGTRNAKQTILRASGHVAGPRSILAWFDRALEQVLLWQERANERRTLRNLSDHMLKDIGISRVDAHREANKRFWQR